VSEGGKSDCKNCCNGSGSIRNYFNFNWSGFPLIFLHLIINWNRFYFLKYGLRTKYYVSLWYSPGPADIPLSGQLLSPA
jgi:hypothetical protein